MRVRLISSIGSARFVLECSRWLLRVVIRHRKFHFGLCERGVALSGVWFVSCLREILCAGNDGGRYRVTTRGCCEDKEELF